MHAGSLDYSPCRIQKGDYAAASVVVPGSFNKQGDSNMDPQAL